MATNEDLEEIYLERAIYLLNTDDMLEQILEDRYNVIPFIPIGQEISQENGIRIETKIPLVFASNF